jgi:hypothetical protein
MLVLPELPDAGVVEIADATELKVVLDDSPVDGMYR